MTMYAQHFGLSAAPFALTPDPAFLYPSPGHREALAAIQCGLLDRRGFVTLVGEVGTGKTTLLNCLLGRVDREIEAAYVCHTTDNFFALLSSALHNLGVEVAPDASKPTLLASFNAHLVRRAEEGRTVALVIDEAQNLSDRAFEELRLASNFETYTGKLLQIVLVGQPELRHRLQQRHLRALRERVGVHAFIDPLSREEMHEYIDHRLRLVGGSARDLFAPDALRLIVRRTAGIPRRANILCHNALLFAYGRELPQVTAKIAREVIAGAERGGATLGGGFIPRLRSWVTQPVDLSSRRTRWAVGAAAAALAMLGIGRVAMVTPSDDAEASRPQIATVPAVPAIPAMPTMKAQDSDIAPPAEPPAETEPAAAAPVEQARADAEPVAAPPPVAPAPEPAPAKSQVLEMTIPEGATLTHLVRRIYGSEATRSKSLLTEIMRLNPDIQDADLIVAGNSLRFPPPGWDGDHAIQEKR